jgi:hypothetical protein
LKRTTAAVSIMAAFVAGFFAVIGWEAYEQSTRAYRYRGRADGRNADAGRGGRSRG